MTVVKFYKTAARAKSVAAKLRGLGFRSFVTMNGHGKRVGVVVRNPRK